MKVLLVASTGGHLAQLLAVGDAWSAHERHWVTFRKADALSALAGEKVTWAFHPTTRNAWNALRNQVLAVVTLLRDRPDVVVSTGAGVSVPFFVAARVLRVRTMYIEVFDRVDEPTLSGRLNYPLSDAFCLQWDEQLSAYPEGVVVGRTL
ncbi:PssD/Cps14F family polysaccharide biosynthesis glycosyltransferase [Aquipuribacter hungaricus]|uniref:PssD/Cps14F family polysaccharide biosynthesis glycosyltransferase n=1 Tax=Aquipuribacter hungaricus TaxID=545624 RepID=A0ABV7WAT0_9MICO